MTQQELTAVVTDPRLTPAAVRLILHVALLGEGSHTVKGTELSILLGGGEKPIRSAIDRAVHCGYLEHQKAGRAGHRFTSLSTEITPPRESFQTGITPLGEAFPENDSPGGVISRTVVVDGDVDGEPPCIPPAQLEERTETVVAGLNGCRGAVRDYLLAHVPEDARRYAYAQTVASWLGGADTSPWRMPDGSVLPEPERPGMLASALNEMAAGDERKMKRPVGDPANLRTKLNILLKQRGGHGNGGKGGNGRGPDGKARREAPGAGSEQGRRRNGFGADLDPTG